jgi:hypothetical protein
VIVWTMDLQSMVIRFLIIGIFIGILIAWWIAGLIISVRIWGKHR